MMSAAWDMLDAKAAGAMISDASGSPVPFDGYTSTSQKETRKMTVGEWFRHARTPTPDEFPWEEKDPFEMALENLSKIEVAA
jgi:hypothetical protein